MVSIKVRVQKSCDLLIKYTDTELRLKITTTNKTVEWGGVDKIYRGQRTLMYNIFIIFDFFLFSPQDFEPVSRHQYIKIYNSIFRSFQ